MATVREHFDTSAKALNAQTEWMLRNGDGTHQTIIIGKISYCFEEYAKYWSFFVPEGSDISLVRYLLNMPNVAQCIISEDEPSQIVGFADRPERYTLELFKFTGRIYLYIDKALTPEFKQQITDIGTQLGFNVVVRDKDYVKKCTELSKPLAFISHDSRDKDSLVRELAFELSIRLCSVWYDEFSLNVGDSLRESIERGLKESRKCVVILSPNFFSNAGWTKAEFNSIYTREIHEEKNVMLPVWHNVSKSEVYNYSPLLADKVALSSSLGVKELAKRLAKVIDE